MKLQAQHWKEPGHRSGQHLPYCVLCISLFSRLTSFLIGLLTHSHSHATEIFILCDTPITAGTLNLADSRLTVRELSFQQNTLLDPRLDRPLPPPFAFQSLSAFLPVFPLSILVPAVTPLTLIIFISRLPRATLQQTRPLTTSSSTTDRHAATLPVDNWISQPYCTAAIQTLLHRHPIQHLLTAIQPTPRLLTRPPRLYDGR